MTDDELEACLAGLSVPPPDAGAPAEEHRRWMEDRQEFVDRVGGLPFDRLTAAQKAKVREVVERTLEGDRQLVAALETRKELLLEAFSMLPGARDAARGYGRTHAAPEGSTRRKA